MSERKNWAQFVCGDSFFMTPGQMKVKAKSTLTDLQILADDIVKDEKVTPEFKSAFDQFFRSSQLILNNIIGSTFERLFIGTNDVIEDQAKRLADFRTQYESLGGIPSAPKPPPPPKGFMEEIKPLAIIGGVIGIMWGASKLVGASASYRKAAYHKPLRKGA